MKQIFCSTALQRGALIFATCLATGFAGNAAEATSGSGQTDPAISKAITLIGDMYLEGTIGRSDGAIALAYYQNLSTSNGRILAAIPPEKLITSSDENPQPDSISAIGVYQVAANQGNPDAFLRLGDLYLDGDLVTADPEKAFSFFEQAAELGSETAAVNIGLMMIDGNGTSHDINGGIALLSEAAGNGNGRALMALGNIYRTGSAEGVDIDAARSFDYYKRAADGGNIAASLITARMMIDGEGTPATPKRGYEIAHQLAEANDPSALLLMGDIHLTGIADLLPPDPVKAYEAYSLASQAGSTTGRKQTALMLIRGEGVGQDPDAGLGILQEMAKAGDASAMYSLGQLYENGSENAVSANLPKAFEYYKNAAAADDPSSKLRMAYMLIEGIGTQRDMKAGAAMLELLVIGGNSDANLMLAEYHSGAIGEGQAQDLNKAFGYYQTAAAAGSGTARVQAALMLLRGQGTEVDQQAGMTLLKSAADAGDPNALLTLGTVYVSGEAGKIDANAAIAAYEAAAARGVAMAYILLGDLYSRGEIIPADGELAVLYYKKAAGIEPPAEVSPINNANTQ
ncbi:MAG: SEL1-like repeat protein [Roseibium sp.]|uniref:SEL1-like repeat protein n=1 Tax=Roseibium sp. TaxID=1936156 RepID=UPI0026264B4C|nr:SEL1-like repeat protein [Roseibium sp.]MCV0424212.1 SEL1-like repeat protein [Roseibium sp.]